jgi:hypothetical protein
MKNKGLKVAYLNIGGKWTNMRTDVTSIIHKRGVQIMALTETHKKKNTQQINIPGFKTHYACRSVNQKKGGGVAILVRADIPSTTWINRTEVTMDNSESVERKGDKTWCIMQKDDRKLAIGTVYMGVEGPKYEEGNKQLMQNLNEDITQLQNEGLQILILGDFNAHIFKIEKEALNKLNDITSSPHPTNKNGQRLIDLTENNDLEIMNSNRVTTGRWTWMRKNQKSIIDYVLASSGVQEEIINMTIDEKSKIFVYPHDHSWIELKIDREIERSHREMVEEKWNITEDVNWERYREHLSKNIKEWNEEVGMNTESEPATLQMYDQLVHIIKKVGNEVVKKIKHSTIIGKQNMPRNVKRKIKKRTKAIRKWKEQCMTANAENTENWIKAKKCIKKAKKAIKKDNAITKMKWIKKNLGQSKHIWTKLNKKHQNDNVEIVTDGTIESTSIEDIKKYVTEYWTNLAAIKKPENDQPDTSSNQQLDTILNREITVEEYNKAKMQLKNGTSVGWDNIPNEFLKYGGADLDKAFAKIFTNIIKEEIVPPEWRNDKLRMLYKKGDKNKCENYRGLSLSSNVSKLFSRIVYTRVNTYVEDNKIIGEMQNAF